MNSPMELSLFQNDQFRLTELSVYNWGSFDGLHSASIDPQGTLITGDNGSGKSTFIDGLMALLLPAGKATFNVAAAQGDKSDRSLVSYMRGSFGSAHDGLNTRTKNKREGPVVTGLRALYRSDHGIEVTLVALFWTTQSTNAWGDFRKIYAVAERNLALKECLDAFGNGGARSLKQWMGSDSTIKCCDENFSEYQESYRRVLRMENKNAPALLARALGLKKIDNLTKLIRDLVLEPSTVKDDARAVVNEFADLVGIHNQLLDARAQQECLSRLPEFNQIIQETGNNIAELEQELLHLPIYFGTICSELWAEKVSTYREEIEAIQLEIKQYLVKEKDASDLIERWHAEYIKFGGGQIELFKSEIENSKQNLDRIIKFSSQYQENVRAFQWSDQLKEEVFLKNIKLAGEMLEKSQKQGHASQNHFADISGRFSNLQDKKKEVMSEIEVIKTRPDSNIDWRFQKLRDELVNSLKLKSETCMFLGELIEVNEDERGWQGAIERALGGRRTTLLVPSEDFSMILRWLNTRHTGLHVRVQKVSGSSRSIQFKENGFLKKLEWRDHDYKNWVQSYLQRFDLECVADEEFEGLPFSMTKQGSIHYESGRSEKNDSYKIDNRKQWYLGFSNKSRLGGLNSELGEIELELKEVGLLLKKSREDLDSIASQKALLEKIKDYQWDNINAPYWQGRVTSLQNELQALEKVGGDLNKAKNRWEEAKDVLTKIQTDRMDLSKSEGELNQSLKHAEAQEAKARSDASLGISDELRMRVEERVGVLSLEQLDQVPYLLQKNREEIDEELKGIRESKNRAERQASNIINNFRNKDKWLPLTVEWRSDISGIDDYINHLQQLEKEGLPKLVDQFVERLNKHATQSLARIHQRLESEREDISDRITVINSVLRRTEFGPGSYLRLGYKRENYPHVIDFEKQIAKVLSQVTSEDHEGRYKQLENVVEILNKASDSVTSANQESLRLLDPRYQMLFLAEEVEAQTGEIRDVLESTSGKSGGEKESFAGIVVAASLAYVLTPEGQDRPVYCTVFLDEAFSNTAEVASRRVLRVFKELNIHVNLITPYKNLNIARDSARSLLLVERDPAVHESRLCEVTWDTIDRMRVEVQNKASLNAPASLEIELVKVEDELKTE